MARHDRSKTESQKQLVGLQASVTLEASGVKQGAGRSVNRTNLGHEALPRAAECVLHSQDRSEEDVHVTGLDFLHRPDVQVHQFGEPLLGQVPTNPLTPQIGSEDSQLLLGWTGQGHAPLRRNAELTDTAQWGVIARALSQNFNTA